MKLAGVVAMASHARSVRSEGASGRAVQCAELGRVIPDERKAGTELGAGGGALRETSMTVQVATTAGWWGTHREGGIGATIGPPPPTASA